LSNLLGVSPGNKETESDFMDSKQAPSVRIMPESKKKKGVRNVWKEIVDFLFFCYEFILVMGLIAASSILPAIPNSLYVFLAVMYVGMQIIIQNQKTNLTVCTMISLLMLILSVLFLIFKIVFTILIYDGSVKFDSTLFLGLGISVEPKNIEFGEIVKTFLSDFICLIVSIMLFVG